MSEDFKEKRIEYLNNWPNVEPFEIEKEYYRLIDNCLSVNPSVFYPFKLCKNPDADYNKAVSLIIEAMDQLKKYPNFSYEFIFKAYDCFSKLYYPTIPQITDKSKQICDNEWSTILTSNIDLCNAFISLLSSIPVKACQYIYKRICERNPENKAYQRITTGISGATTTSSNNRKMYIDTIKTTYGFDYNDYPNTIRKASLLYRYILRHDSFSLNSQTYTVSINDKLHIIFSGFLYTLRNDMMHGSSISITKSSKTTIGTFATDYYAFLVLYYLLVMLIIDHFRSDYSSDIYEKLADNINTNVKLFREIFGKEIEK